MFTSHEADLLITLLLHRHVSLPPKSLLPTQLLPGLVAPYCILGVPSYRQICIVIWSIFLQLSFSADWRICEDQPSTWQDMGCIDHLIERWNTCYKGTSQPLYQKREQEDLIVEIWRIRASWRRDAACRYPLSICGRENHKSPFARASTV